MDQLIRNQMKVEIEQLPELLKACVEKYIDSFDWYFYFRELEEGSYTYLTIKRRREK